MSKSIYPSIISILLVISLAAGCQSKSQAGDTGLGDAKRGKLLYEKTTLGASVAPGCVTCHSFDANFVLVGPPLSGVASRAENLVQGKSAEEYLRESIVAPNAYIADGFSEGVMYQNYAEDLTAQEINDIVAFLLTLNY